jgi:hypothetical protein
MNRQSQTVKEDEAQSNPVPEGLGLGAAPCSASGPKTIAEWFCYLLETGNLDSYQGSCGCWKCKKILADFDEWKRKQNGQDEGSLADGNQSPQK